jgi:hypothetical protein
MLSSRHRQGSSQLQPKEKASMTVEAITANQVEVLGI